MKTTVAHVVELLQLGKWSHLNAERYIVIEAQRSEALPPGNVGAEMEIAYKIAHLKLRVKISPKKDKNI